MSTSDEIKAVEDRIDKRREILARRYDDVKHELSTVASKAVRSWPVVAVAGGLAAGYAISRAGRPRPSYQAPVQYVPVRAANGATRARGRNLLAAIAGIAATALRIGASSEARTFFNAVKRFRNRHHAH
jgi:hypothetical protein